MMETFSCDIETDGLNPTKVWCIAVQNIYDESTKMWYPEEGWDTNDNGSFQEWLDLEDVYTLVFHNGIAFDVPVLEKLHNINFSNVEIEDTIQWERVLELNETEELLDTNRKHYIKSNLKTFYKPHVELLLPYPGWWGKVQHGLALNAIVAPLISS